ncbi:MAG: GHKL domain-containing protein [Candidatus Eisenbacteria bacterium]|nr:GHKL domain-containing protein [Candidatus Eisenbacteria bacterium]
MRRFRSATNMLSRTHSRIKDQALELLCAPALLILLAAGCVESPPRLSGTEARYPYSLVPAIQTVSRPIRIGIADFDGDGIDEEVKHALAKGGTSYLNVARVAEERHYALWTRHFFNAAGLSGLWDVTGDGAPEIVFWEQVSRDTVRAVVSQLTITGRAAADSVLHEIRFSTEGAILPDGTWAGRMILKGGFDADGDGADDVLALAVTAGIFGRPRGVWFWDLSLGTFTARVPTAATASAVAEMADVDGDGARELVIGLVSPNNGVTAGEWDDSCSYVVVFDRTGDVIWWRELGGVSSMVDLVVCDLEGDGSLEIATAVWGHSELDAERFGLYVWRGSDGALLCRKRFGCSVNSVDAMLRGGETKLLTGCSDGIVHRLGWTEGGLVVEGSLDCRDGVECVRSVPIGSPGEAVGGVAISTVRGSVIVLDADLTPLAVARTDETVMGKGNVLRSTTLPLGGEPYASLMALSQTSVWRFRLVRKPVPFWLKAALPIGVVLGVLAAVPVTRRAGIAALRRALVPAGSRGETLDALLSSLTAASHGKLAATSTFRRLREQLRMLQSFEGPTPEVFSKRYFQAVSDVGDVALPEIREIASQAVRAGLAPEAAAALSEAADHLSSLLRDLPRDLPSQAGAAAVGARLDALLPQVESSLLAIKRAALLERSCDAGAELDRALNSRAPDLDRQGVDITVSGRPLLDGLRVCGTSAELSFIIENLLGNAFDAVRDGETRRISLSADVRGEHVVITVGDTGKGIEARDRERIFEEGVSGKAAGGGHGLARSREILSKRGGSLRLVESSPGEGSVFELRLALCGVARRVR